jgi:hypothetical protein
MPTTEGAHNASCNLSGNEDRWGAALGNSR